MSDHHVPSLQIPTVRHRSSAAGRVRTAAAAGAALLALAGCSSSAATGSGGGHGLTVAAVRKAATALGSTGGACPLHLDLAAALGAAGVPGSSAAPDTSDGPAATGVTPAGADPSSPAKQYDFSMITCSFVLTGTGAAPRTDLTLNLGASPISPNAALNVLAPALQRDGELSTTDLKAFIEAPAPVGQTRLTPGDGTATYTRLPASGSDSIGLELGIRAPQDGQHSPLAGTPLQKLATALAGQVRLG